MKKQQNTKNPIRVINHIFFIALLIAVSFSVVVVISLIFKIFNNYSNDRSFQEKSLSKNGDTIYLHEITPSPKSNSTSTKKQNENTETEKSEAYIALAKTLKEYELEERKKIKETEKSKKDSRLVSKQSSAIKKIEAKSKESFSGFGPLKWGDTPKNVADKFGVIEPTKPNESDIYDKYVPKSSNIKIFELVYKQNGYDEIRLYFLHDKLYMCKAYIKAYNSDFKLKLISHTIEKLNAKYGEPTTSGTVFSKRNSGNYRTTIKWEFTELVLEALKSYDFALSTEWLSLTYGNPKIYEKIKSISHNKVKELDNQIKDMAHAF